MATDDRLTAAMNALGKRRIYVVSGESLAEWTVYDLPEFDALREAHEALRAERDLYKSRAAAFQNELKKRSLPDAHE